MCAVNKTCAAVLYNESASICHMSGEPEVQNISGVVPNAFVKLEQTVVLLALKGLCFSFLTFFLLLVLHTPLIALS